MRAFLDAGIAVDARNSAGSTALHIAVAEGHGGIVRLLLRHGMDVDVEAEATKSTPLHVAAARGKAEMARTLIDQGADVNARDYYNSTPLHDLARHNWAIDYRPTARLLLSRGANVNARNDAGETPLRVVQRRDSERAKAVAQLLLQHGGRE